MACSIPGLLLILIIQINILPNKPPSKTALLIAISDYGEQSGWAPLNAHNDIEPVKDALIQQGFEGNDIRIIQDGQATREGILAAFEKHLLDQAAKGGTAVFFFSGHGQQVQDDNGDELDGLDEALVTYGSPLHYTKGQYEGELLIRDDELGDLLRKLRKKLGKTGHVLAILDACHSGTGTRALTSARGTETVMADSSYLAQLKANAGADATLGLAPQEGISKMASMVTFSGSGAQELNYEMVRPDGQRMGSLSYAFSKAFGNAQKTDSYRHLFDQIRLTMSSEVPNQTPQAEGELDQQLLGGSILGKTPYFKLDIQGWRDSLNVLLKSGTLEGLFPGTQLGFFPPDTRDPSQAQPMATATVEKAKLAFCEIRLDAPLSREKALEAWIFVIQQGYGDLTVKVHAHLGNSQFGAAFMEVVGEYPVIQLVEESPDLILERSDSLSSVERFRILTRDEYVLWEGRQRRSSAFMAQEALKVILSYVQCQFLRNLEMRHTWLDVGVELVKQEAEEQKSATEDLQKIKVGATFRIRVINRGMVPAYFSILDIQPDNVVHILLPPANAARTKEEYYLEPGESRLYDTEFKIYPPLGTEVLKVIATDTPLDLSAIIDSRGTESDDGHPFEQLFASTYLYYNRGSAVRSLYPDMRIESKVFEIVK